MGKKIRYKYLIGSTIRPLLRYVTGWQFCVNPLDKRGTNLAHHWYRKAIQQNPKISQVTQPIIMKSDDTIVSSYLIVKFIDGKRQGIFLRNSNDFTIEQHISNISQIIQYQRALEDYQDDPEDQFTGAKDFQIQRPVQKISKEELAVLKEGLDTNQFVYKNQNQKLKQQQLIKPLTRQYQYQNNKPYLNMQLYSPKLRNISQTNQYNPIRDLQIKYPKQFQMGNINILQNEKHQKNNLGFNLGRYRNTLNRVKSSPLFSHRSNFNHYNLQNLYNVYKYKPYQRKYHFDQGYFQNNNMAKSRVYSSLFNPYDQYPKPDYPLFYNFNKYSSYPYKKSAYNHLYPKYRFSRNKYNQTKDQKKKPIVTEKLQKKYGIADVLLSNGFQRIVNKQELYHYKVSSKDNTINNYNKYRYI